MISIVICSRSSHIDKALEDNIKNTIGNVKYEIILVDNSHNNYSIFSAYNLALKQAEYPYVCFMHEDILYKIEDWGQIVIDAFKDENVGLCGVIGSKYISKVPCGWWLSYSRRGKIEEKRKEGDVKENFGAEDCEEVVTIDGVWLCLRKKMFPNISFDEINFSGFHCYDMDISLQVKQSGYKIVLLPKIAIYHKSQGCLNDSFYINYMFLLKKWRNFLPVYVDLDKREKLKNIEFVKSNICGISKENYFYRYTNSVVFKLLIMIEKKIGLSLSSLFVFTYSKGFRIYTFLVNRKILNIFI